MRCQSEISVFKSLGRCEDGTGPAVQLRPESSFCLSRLKVMSFKNFNISKLASWHLEIVWTTVNGMPEEHSNLLRKHTERKRPIISQNKTKLT